MSTNVNSNTWYNVCYGSPPSSVCIVAAGINNSNLGAIEAVNATVPNEPAYNWQLLPIAPASTIYLLRSRLLGPTYCVHMWWDNVTDLTLPGFVENTSPSQATTTAQWILSPTSDGADVDFLSTVANGTNWHLDRTNGGMLFLESSSVTGSTDPQGFGFSSVAAIDDTIWSYTATSTSAVPTTSTTSATSNIAASTTPATNDTTGESAPPVIHHAPTGAIAGGVVGGIAVLLLLLGAILFYLRRRKRTRNKDYLHQSQASILPPELGPARPHELGPARPHEIEGQPLFIKRP